MENPFDRWNDIKKQLASDPSRPPAFPKSGEVWMCMLGKNLGREQDGGSRDFSRPVLVVKKLKAARFLFQLQRPERRPRRRRARTIASCEH
jgi:hypothetical protein